MDYHHLDLYKQHWEKHINFHIVSGTKIMRKVTVSSLRNGNCNFPHNFRSGNYVEIYVFFPVQGISEI